MNFNNSPWQQPHTNESDESERPLAATGNASAESEPPTALPRDWKTDARQAFERWLQAQPDEASEKDATDLLDLQAAGGDLLHVIGELTALKQEVRGLGRSSARLAAASGQSTDQLVDVVKTIADDLRAAGREAAQRARIDVERPMLLELGDVREALREMVARATQWPRKHRWFNRRNPACGAEPVSLDAVKVLVRRIDVMLERHGVETIGAPDAVFDGRCMTAVGISRERQVAPGHVSAVVRVGFRADSVLLRPAEVIVEPEENVS